MLMYMYVFIKFILLSYAADKISGQSFLQGCTSVGLTSCCQSEPCNVATNIGNCFCDSLCYSTRDCCGDIEFICPPSENSESEDDLDFDFISGSGSGSGHPGSGSGNGNPQTERPPNLRIISSRIHRITLNSSSRLFIDLEYCPGNPPGLLTWRRNGFIISSRIDPRVTILRRGGLTVRNVKVSDVGLYTVSVSNRLGNVMENFTVILESPVEVKFQKPLYSVVEESGQVDIMCVVANFGNVRSPVNVKILASSVSAQVGIDYRLLSSSNITLDPDDPISCVRTEIIDDQIAEKIEAFQLSLETDDDLVQITMSNTTVLILDNDFIDVIFEETLYEVDESVADGLHLALRLCVLHNLSHIVSQFEGPDSIEISIFTVDGTAVGGVDYMERRNSHSFSLIRNSTQDVCECIPIFSDKLAEGDEFFEVVAVSPDKRILGTRSKVKIKDDDVVKINLEMSEYTVEEGSSPLEVCITATGGTTSRIAIYLCTEGSTALDTEDYIGLTAFRVEFSLDVHDSVQRECVTIPIIDDNLSESEERFFLGLQADPRMQGVVSLGINTTAVVTIFDNDIPDAVFINNTPFVQGNSIMINFVIRGYQFSSLVCTLKGPGRTLPRVEDCSSGVLVFSGVTFRYQEFLITIEGVEGNGNRITLLKRPVRIDSDVCSMHLINRGLKLTGNNATVEWQATGPTATNKVTDFICWKDRMRAISSCVSPFTWNNLSPGTHRLIVRPAMTHGCRRHIKKTFYFTV